MAAIDVKGVSQLRPLNATRKPTAVTSKTTKPGEDGKGKRESWKTSWPLLELIAVSSCRKPNTSRSPTSSCISHTKQSCPISNFLHFFFQNNCQESDCLPHRELSVKAIKQGQSWSCSRFPTPCTSEGSQELDFDYLHTSQASPAARR